MVIVGELEKCKAKKPGGRNKRGGKHAKMLSIILS